MRALVTFSTVSVHSFITELYLSSSEIKPLLYCLTIFSILSSVSFRYLCLTSGITMSDTLMVMAPFVEYLNPRALTLSSISAVSVVPCVLMALSIILPRAFLSTRKVTSRSKKLSGLDLSTNPKSCGMASLNISLPTVASISFETVFPSLSFVILTFIGA